MPLVNNRTDRYALQLLDPSGITEIAVILFSPQSQPQMVSWDSAARAAVQQTIGGQYLDHFGKGPDKWRLSGDTGFSREIADLALVDGFRQMKRFRDLWEQANRNDPNGDARRVYFYSFSEDVFQWVNIDRFSVRRSVTKNFIWSYEIELTELADFAMWPPTSDPLLRFFQLRRGVLAWINDKIDAFLDWAGLPTELSSWIGYGALNALRGDLSETLTPIQSGIESVIEGAGLSAVPVDKVRDAQNALKPFVWGRDSDQSMKQAKSAIDNGTLSPSVLTMLADLNTALGMLERIDSALPIDGTGEVLPTPDESLASTPLYLANQRAARLGYVVSGKIRERTVLEGENLAAIAQREYGNPDLWEVLAEFNGIRFDGITLAAGQTLYIPEIRRVR